MLGVALVCAALWAQGPEDIVLPYASSGEDVARLQDEDALLIADYTRRSAWILLGTVSSVVPVQDNAAEHERVILSVDEALRGKAGDVFELTIPVRPGQGSPASAVEGYQVVVFVDRGQELIDGRALFYVQAGQLWRNRRDGVFLRPSADRDWVSSIDPMVDYTIYPLDEVRQQARKRRSRWRR